ncbi:plasmid mobilization relaxosome protein MobC [Streptomyces sp. WAC01280]|uniref:plasmid mobilization relaxosome protein MobC n=1 Tax=Streptomyces sp. WAC01280 TaxID=2487424 RepID=UPI000F7A24B4|nr:plasmid mobilization relaxosome protein MobC [Streptomyces sp. WAC01280]RSS50086.1 plasmid mobilization relaxosome protein MobC [Streptomyces sp. WAC01280]
MARGTPGSKRAHTVSVRLNDGERERWDEARVASGRRELGAWVRAVVEDVLDGQVDGETPGAEREPAPLDPVTQAAYDELVRIGANLNQLVRYSHQDGALHPAVEAALFEVGNAALALRGIEPMRPTDPE